MTDAILELCRTRGFAHAGICRAEPSAYAEAFRRWVEQEQHGEMDYLARNMSIRLDPAELFDGARSIICVADRHHAGDPDDARPGFGRIARYARGNDYHKCMKQRLHDLCDVLSAQYPEASFRAFVDTAPLLEREHAQRAGLGAVGKNTLLLRRGEGSYLLLGSILTTLALDPSTPATPDPCESCTRCIDACPTDAITPWSVDARACISYLTIEHRSPIDPRLHEAIGDWIFGCDICQEVCPHNQPTERTTDFDVLDSYAPRRQGFDLLEVLGWNEDQRRVAFERSSMKRARLDMMQRNAAIAAGNALRQSDDAALHAALRGALDRLADVDGMVGETVRVVRDGLSR